jgi:hypothetical protein
MKRNLKTVAEFAAAGPFSQGQLRWWIFNAANNGLSHAIVRVQRRIYIDVDKFEAWIDSQNQQTPVAA